MTFQTELFGPVMAAYNSGQALSNAELYETLSSSDVIAPGALLERIPVGKSGQLHNPTQRKLRWTADTQKAGLA